MPCIPAISSHSLGRAFAHDIRPKLDEAARSGLDIELFFEDLEYLANSLPANSGIEKYHEAARIIRSLCDERGISIVCLQPFMHHEGLRDRQKHRQKLSEMRNWIQLAKILRTQIISIPSTFLPESEVSGDIELIVQDLQDAADIAAIHGIQIAYEALAWGTYVNTWEQAWHIVEKVNRWNFGICLDTFNMAAKIFADPTAASRKTPDAEWTLKKSLDKLKSIDVSKILYVQVVDAEYLSRPLVEGHEYYNSRQHPRMSWSRNCRLFYGEEGLGAYLPIRQILEVILNDLGFTGWISAELFNVSLTKISISIPREHAERASTSFRKIANDFNIDLTSNRRTTSPPREVIEIVSRAQL